MHYVRGSQRRSAGHEMRRVPMWMPFTTSNAIALQQRATTVSRWVIFLVGIALLLAAGCTAPVPLPSPTTVLVKPCPAPVRDWPYLRFEAMPSSTPLLDQVKALAMDRETLIAELKITRGILDECRER